MFYFSFYLFLLLNLLPPKWLHIIFYGCKITNNSSLKFEYMATRP